MPIDPPRADEPFAAERDTSLHVRRAREGQPESLGWIVARFSPALIAQARYRLGRLPPGLCDAEDLVQDVWLATLPKLPDLPPRDGRYTRVVMKFLSTALLNRTNTLAQKHLAGKPARAAFESSAGVDGMPSGFADATTNVVSRAVRSELAQAVQLAIERLEPRDREVLILRGIEQNSTETVAMLLKLRPNTVSVRFRRALKRLRQELPQSLFDDID